MSRDVTGTYTLPVGNPVVTGTAISSTWANDSLSDIATTLTNSLDRLGNGAMLAPLKLPNGTASDPTLTFASEATSGWYRQAAGVMSASLLGVKVLELNATNAVLSGGLLVGGFLGDAVLAYTNQKDVVAGRFITARGSTSAANGVPTTLLFLSTDLDHGVYLGCTALVADDVANFSNVFLLIVQGTSSRCVSLATSTLLTTDLASPTNGLFATQSSGLTQTIHWTITRIQ
jgi:hypothetical protein